MSTESDSIFQQMWAEGVGLIESKPGESAGTSWTPTTFLGRVKNLKDRGKIKKNISNSSTLKWRHGKCIPVGANRDLIKHVFGLIQKHRNCIKSEGNDSDGGDCEACKWIQKLDYWFTGTAPPEGKRTPVVTLCWRYEGVAHNGPSRMVDFQIADAEGEKPVLVASLSYRPVRARLPEDGDLPAMWLEVMPAQIDIELNLKGAKSAGDWFQKEPRVSSGAGFVRVRNLDAEGRVYNDWAPLKENILVTLEGATKDASGARRRVCGPQCFALGPGSTRLGGRHERDRQARPSKRAEALRRSKERASDDACGGHV